MKKRIKIRRDLKELQLKKSVLFGAVIVFFSTSVLTYAFLFSVREVCGLFTIHGNYNSVIYEINPWWYAFFNFIFAGFAIINGINSTLNFISKTNDRGHSIRMRKALRYTATNTTILFPSFLHTALEVTFCIAIISGWDLLFKYGLEPITLSILVLTLVVFYFHTWNLILKYYPQFLTKIIKGFFIFLLSAFLLSLWHPIKMIEIKKEIVETYTQYQMEIELPRSSVVKYTRRHPNIGEVFLGKNGEYRERMIPLNTSDMMIRLPRSKWGTYAYLTIVADVEVKMKEVIPIDKSYDGELIRRYYFATESPDFIPNAKVYRRYFGQGRLFKIGLKNDLPAKSTYSTERKMRAFLNDKPYDDFSDYFADKTFIQLRKDSIFFDNQWIIKDDFVEKLRNAQNQRPGFCILIDGELTIREFIHDMDVLPFVRTEDLFLTFDLEEYEFLEKQKGL